MKFVVIDFEAICDEPYNPDPQEIIEFPEVLVDVVLRPGDWACPRCGFGNFAYRDKCFDRGTPRAAKASKLTGALHKFVRAALPIPFDKPAKVIVTVLEELVP